MHLIPLSLWSEPDDTDIFLDLPVDVFGALD